MNLNFPAKKCKFCHLVRKSDDERTCGLRVFLQIISLSYVNKKLILKRIGGNFELLEILVHLKFIYSEKATKFCEIFPLLLTNKFVFFVSRYSFELQSLFVWFSVLKLNSLRWLLVYKLSQFWQCLKCLSNLLKIQNWAGNTEKQVIGQK